MGDSRGYLFASAFAAVRKGRARGQCVVLLGTGRLYAQRRM